MMLENMERPKEGYYAEELIMERRILSAAIEFLSGRKVFSTLVTIFEYQE
jgi:hypothetical protein